MDIPNDLVDAARVLVVTANPSFRESVRELVPGAVATGLVLQPVAAPDRRWEVPGWTNNPTPPGTDPDTVVDTLTAWRALTLPEFPPLRSRAARQRKTGVDPELPEVVVTGDPVVRIGPNPPRVPLASRPVRDDQRPRFVVPALRPADSPRKFLSTPDDAHRVVLGGLSARLAADRLEAWIPSLLAGEARRAGAEVDAYRTYATAATAQLPALFTWVADVPEPAPAFSGPPTVPTVLARIGREGS